MRMVLIAVIAVLVIGGGAGGAYFYFMKPANASVGAEAAKATEHAEEPKEHKEVEYVKLDPLILPVIDQDGVQQVVSLVVAIELEDKSNTDTVKMLIPRLTDAFIQDMYGAVTKNAMKNGVIQTHILKERLNKISQKVLGSGIKNDVLLQVVQQRPA